MLKGLKLETYLIYLDNVVVWGRTFPEELDRLEEVFSRFSSAGLKLKPRKCLLFQTSVPYLGHIVTDKQIQLKLRK